MHVTEQQLRTITLAQAIEQADPRHQLVSPPEWAEALDTAIHAARARGVQRVGVDDVVLERAAAAVARASGRDTTVAALAQPSTRLRTLGRALPLAALVLGLAADRIANAHRVDLLSPPLLLVLAWNLFMYALLAWRAWRGPGTGASTEAGALHTLCGWVAALGKAKSRIAVEFQRRWLPQTAPLLALRAERVLHLCAAAWAAGIALSLLLRGLVVRYQFGWESTFLDAVQVHAIVSVLFWPLTHVLGLAPFSLQDIAATQNFAGEGVAGSRWVWMYVGLLALAVIVPRLALAAWAHWHEARAARHCTLDTDASAFDALRHALPADLALGIAGTPVHPPTLHGLLALHTPQGDRLHAAEAAQPPDAVLQLDGGTPLPPAWAGAPVLALRWNEFGTSWVQEPVLFERLAAMLPARAQALGRLREACEARNEQRFADALQVLAQHLRACAQLDGGDGNGDSTARYATLLHTLDARLGAAPAAPPERAALAPPAAATEQRPSLGATSAGAMAGAAAGAAAGAKVGAMIDVGTGGLTLGAGTALGALLGGGTAWAVRAFQKKGAVQATRQEALQDMAEAACLRYLALAHQDRVDAAEAARLAARWRAEVTAAVAAQGAALEAALRAPSGEDLQPLLRTVLLGALRRSLEA